MVVRSVKKQAMSVCLDKMRKSKKGDENFLKLANAYQIRE
jgi:hypothetical protein